MPTGKQGGHLRRSQLAQAEKPLELGVFPDANQTQPGPAFVDTRKLLDQVDHDGLIEQACIEPQHDFSVVLCLFQLLVPGREFLQRTLIRLRILLIDKEPGACLTIHLVVDSAGHRSFENWIVPHQHFASHRALTQ